MKGFILLITFGFAGMNILFVDNTDYILLFFCHVHENSGCAKIIVAKNG
jgi:hypothetical protein